MTRYKLCISYDGTAYAGWQIQPNGVTIQATIEAAIRKITNETVKLHGSGRTDQGVHARRQVAHFDLKRTWRTRDLLRALNGTLPRDIRILNASKASADFHARRSAKHKEYRYFVWNARILPPFLRNYRAQVVAPLDVPAMKKAASLIEGKHNFLSFTANPRQLVESTTRHLMQLSVRKRGHEVVIIARADGFLYKMVRSLAGFLIQVGKGELRPEDGMTILNSRLRTARVPTAAASGLFLWNVTY